MPFPFIYAQIMELAASFLACDVELVMTVRQPLYMVHTLTLSPRTAPGTRIVVTAQSDAATPWLQARGLCASKCHLGPWASTFSLRSLHTNDLGSPGIRWVRASWTYV